MSDNLFKKDGKDKPQDAGEAAAAAGIKDACPFLGAMPFVQPKQGGIVSSLRGGQQPEIEQGIMYPPCIKQGCHFWDGKHGCIVRAGLLKLAEAR